MTILVAAGSGCRSTAGVAPLPASIEQTTMGTAAPAVLVEAFDGLGDGFIGPQGRAALRNPSDNSLAVGRDHIVQIVNTRLAIFSHAGGRESYAAQRFPGFCGAAVCPSAGAGLDRNSAIRVARLRSVRDVLRGERDSRSDGWLVSL